MWSLGSARGPFTPRKKARIGPSELPLPLQCNSEFPTRENEICLPSFVLGWYGICHGVFQEKTAFLDDFQRKFRNASVFTKCLFTILVTLNLPPLPKQRSDGFPLEFLLKGPQTELRTLRQNCEQNLQKLRANRIMNKRAFLKNVSFVVVSPSL